MLRVYHTIRHYRLRQIFFRLLSKARALRAPHRFRQLCDQEGLRVRAALPQIAVPPTEGARLIYEGNTICFYLLNHTYTTSNDLDWRALERHLTSRLLRFHLHYHEYFLPKTSDNTFPASIRLIWQWMGRWIEKYSSRKSEFSLDAWHPYVISRRIPVWIKLFSQDPPESPLAEAVLASLTAQARWLRRSLEFDLGGNHLIQNLRALAVAGAFFAGPEADEWTQTACRLLKLECREQILPHGEHFERAPMYHVDVLLALMDIRDSLASAGLNIPDYLEESIDKMLSFLGEILHPDGQIPLFGDSTFDLTPNPQQVFSRYGKILPNLTPNVAHSKVVGDYWIYREGGNFLIFDAGPVGPDHLPAHAHADLLTLEGSLNGKRLFVDSGMYDYEDSPERAYCRSTAAHNTFEINGENQCDVWSRFRMGRRGWPGRLVHGQAGPFHWASCTHNAYRHLGVAKVGRTVICTEGGPWCIIDWAEGKGTPQLISRLRIGPDWSCEKYRSDAVVVKSGESELSIITLPNSRGAACESATWYPRFGTAQSIYVVSQRYDAHSLPVRLGWIIAPTTGDSLQVDSHATEIRLRWRNQGHAVPVPH
ncbi:MAG: heparinase II/III domain-containing protein [Thermogutta sp.]